MDEDEDRFEKEGGTMDENGSKSEGKDSRRIDEDGDEGGGDKYGEGVEEGQER